MKNCLVGGWDLTTLILIYCSREISLWYRTYLLAFGVSLTGVDKSQPMNDDHSRDDTVIDASLRAIETLYESVLISTILGDGD